MTDLGPQETVTLSLAHVDFPSRAIAVGQRGGVLKAQAASKSVWRFKRWRRTSTCAPPNKTEPDQLHGIMTSVRPSEDHS